MVIFHNQGEESERRILLNLRAAKEIVTIKKQWKRKVFYSNPFVRNGKEENDSDVVSFYGINGIE